MPKPPIELDPNLSPWQQQQGENSRWYGRFLAFRDMGLSRSLLGTYKQELAEKGRKEQDKASVPNSWNNAAKQFRWEDRAQSWDAHRQQEIEAERREEERRDRALWIERRQAQREKQWELSEQLVERAMTMLQSPLHVEKKDDEGKTVLVPARWSFRDAATFIDLADKLRKSATAIDITEIDALTTLIKAGWIPEKLLDEVADRYWEMKAKILEAFQSPDAQN